MKSETMERAPVHKWWVFAAVGVGAFMAAFSGSVVNATLPLIQRDLAADVATIEWVVTVYLVLVSGLLLSFGRVGDLRGHGRVYMAGFGVFVIGSALCAFAATVGQLIAFRGVQALGGAMLFATSPAILTGSFPAAERGRALGLQATLTYLGLTAGPSVGGWLARQYGWQADLSLQRAGGTDCARPEPALRAPRRPGGARATASTGPARSRSWRGCRCCCWR